MGDGGTALMETFDDVRCEATLPPHKGEPGRDFQTKFFDDPYFRKFVITADGRLTCDEAVPGLDTITCDLDFYEYQTRTGEWWEFVARFVDGNLLSIRLADYSAAEDREAETSDTPVSP
jgi:hypothetical protein